MNIVIDVRCLMGGKISGVEVYTKNLIEKLLELDQKNTYIFFSNASEDQSKFMPKFDQPNVTFIQTRIPNKIFNIALSFLKRPCLDEFILNYLEKNPGQKPKTMKKNSIDIFFMPDIRPLALSKNTLQITVVHDLSFHHFPHFFSKKTRLWYKILRPKSILKKSDKIIAVSKFTQKDLIKTYSIPSGKIKVISEGVKENFDQSQTQFQKIKTKYRLPHEYFLFLATLEPRKNMERLVKAFQDFKKENPKSKIKLVLAGKSHAIFKPVSKIYESDDNIISCGFIEEEDKAAIMKNAKAFLYPSLFEGFGLPLVEAMKCKTPIITSNRSSMPEIIGKSGLLVNPYSKKEIKNAMEKILQKKVKTRLLKEAEKQIKKFSWEKCATQTLKLFENCQKEKLVQNLDVKSSNIQ